MRILLIANYTAEGQESMQRFAELLRSLLLEAGHSVAVLRPAAFFGRLPTFNGNPSKWLGYIDRFLVFPPFLLMAASKKDVVHICDQGNAMYVCLLGGRPHVVTCHDLTAIRSARGETPEHVTRWSGRLLQRWVLSGLKNADCLVCVSSQTREDAVRLLGGGQRSPTVVHNALNFNYRHVERTKALERLLAMGLDGSRPFLLHVGGNQWYKNREGVIRIFAEIARFPGAGEYLLVTAGKAWTEDMRDLVDRLGLRRRVVELTTSPTRTWALYTRPPADCSFPHSTRGLAGLSIEAQACGCPVFASDRPPLPEIAGSGAVYFDPHDEREAAHLVWEGLADPVPLIDKGRANAARFSRDEMARGYIAAYQGVLKRRIRRGLERSGSGE